jgi:hypothetical protein
VHGVVARRTFGSENLQSTQLSDHVWKLRRRKSASRSGAIIFVNEQLKNNLTFGPFLEVEMSKKCTALWRETHFDFKMLKY